MLRISALIGPVTSVALCALALTSASAQDGTDMVLESSFGHRGILSIPGEQITVTTAYPGGRLVAARGGPNGIIVERYLSNGSHDSDFGSGSGDVIVDRPSRYPTPLNWTPSAITVGGGGEIIVAGYSQRELGPEAEGGYHPHEAFVARLLAGGKVDWVTEEPYEEPAGAEGRRFPLGFSGATIEVVEMQGAKILLGGTIGGETDRDRGFVARFNSDGTPDESFAGGSAATSIPPGTKGKGVSRFSAFSQVHALLSVPGGPIYAAGSIRSCLMLVRLSPDGRLDRRFGRDGIVRSKSRPREIWEARSIARDAVGRLLISGVGKSLFIGLARFLPDGRRDRRFGDGGSVGARLQEDSFGGGVAVQPDGRILVAGVAKRRRSSVRPGEKYFVALIGYRPDGRLDRSFFGDGVFTRPYGRGWFVPDFAWTLNLDSAGLFLTGGNVAMRFRSVR
jgi:uncharacterized delta-60 repeat protein